MAANNDVTKQTRHETTIDLSSVREGERIASDLVQRDPSIKAGQPLDEFADYRPGDERDGRTYDCNLIAWSQHGTYNDFETAIVFDPDAELFARLTRHSNDAAMTLAESDWKVRSLGSDVEMTDLLDADIPDLEEFDQTEEEFVQEWLEITFGDARFGDDINEIEDLEADVLTFRDWDNRYAKFSIQFVGGNN
jgi:hypothetical protein